MRYKKIFVYLPPLASITNLILQTMSNKFELNEQDPKPSILTIVLKIVIYAAGLIAAYYGVNAAAKVL